MNVTLEEAGNPRDLASRIRGELKKAGDAKAAARAELLMPGVLSVFGTPMPVVTKLAGELAKMGRKSPSAITPVLDELWAAGSLEERQLAGKVLERLGKRHPVECLAVIERWLPGLDCWTNCDNLACFSMKDIALMNPDDIIGRCRRWAADRNKWIRRFGVVVLRAFEKQKAPREVFRVLDVFRDEFEPDVQKAVAWMLRSLSAHDSGEVLAVLSRWAEGADASRARMIREGMKKLPAAGQRQLKERLLAP